MFDDVPEELNRWVREAPKNLRTPKMLQAVAAMAVLKHYLGRDLFDETDPFLVFPDDPDGRGSWKFPIRVHQIAEAVFTLRNEPGFPEITRRLATRDLRSAHFETFAATMFQHHGFAIHARPETLTAGADFDFAICKENAEANVEATALTGETFNPSSIRNALSKKRKQLPSDKPAIIVCFIPGAWRTQVFRPYDTALASLADEFLRRTQRINHLFFAEDVLLQLTGGRGLAFVRSMVFRNENPRHDSPSLDALLDAPTAINDQSREMALNPPKNAESVATGQLIEWVDWLTR